MKHIGPQDRSPCAALLGVLAAIGFAAVANAAPPVVRTVPWSGINPLIPHDTYSNKLVTLKGTCNQQGANLRWTWDFGDGSRTNGIVSTTTNIGARHTYVGDIGTLYTARLTVTNTTTGEAAATEYRIRVQPKTLIVETHIAIDEALWWLFTNSRRSGTNYYWYNGPTSDSTYVNYNVNSTASAVQAFEVLGHRENQVDNPYSEAIRGGLDFLFTRLYVQTMSTQDGANPDSNNNGIGISAPLGAIGHPVYELGAVMDALVASGTPDATARTGPANVIGRRYQDIVQDMVDMYAWGQADSGVYRGGWRYLWNADADNSASQWAAIGMSAAERTAAHIDPGPDGLLGTPDDVVLDYWAVVPQWVKDRNLQWLATSRNSDGFFGYADINSSHPLSTGPCGMVQLAFDGIGTNDARWVACENYVANRWSTFISSARNGDGRYYSYYAFMKAMTRAVPAPVVRIRPTGLDWWGDESIGLARVLVNLQQADGYWAYDGWPYVGEQTAAGWFVMILNKTIIPGPVAVAKANPNPAATNQIIQLSGKDSYHNDPSKVIDSWEWDLGNDGVFDTNGPVIVTSFANVGTNTVRLRVTDNGVGTNELAAETTVQIRVVRPPISPTAVAGGPYIFSTNAKPWYLDGRGSVNPDEGVWLNCATNTSGVPDTIVEYGWDLDGDRDFNDATGAVVNVTALFEAKGPGNYVVQLRVRDRTSRSFPCWGSGDLVATDTAYVYVTNRTCTTLEATCQEGRVLLAWDNVAAASYHIYRATNSGGPYSSIATNSMGVTNYLDTDVAAQTTYYYVVRPAALNTDELCQSVEAAARPFYRPVALCRSLVVSNDPGTCHAAVPPGAWNDGSYDPDGDPITFALVPPGPYPIGVTEVAFSVTDHPSGNTNSCQGSEFTVSCTNTVAIRVLDNEPPAIVCPSNIVQSTDPGKCSAIVNFTATVTDNCTNVTVSCAPPSGAEYTKGTTTVTCTATDGAGNTNVCAFTVTVVDREAPQITCPADIVQSTDSGKCAALVAFTATASDNCTNATVVCTPPSGSEFAKGSTTVTCTATDGVGNTNTCAFTVSIQDITPPALTCAGARTEECGTPWTFSTPSALDICEGTNVTVRVLGTVTNAASCAGTFSATRTWEAVDSSTNRATCSQTITVADTTPPTIACSPNRTVECGEAWNFIEPTASDNCGQTALAIVSTVTNATSSNTYTATRTWEATDPCGNTVRCSQTVAVMDRTPPTITCPPAVVAESTNGVEAVVTFPVTAADACSTATVVCLPPSGSTFPLGTTPVMCTARDSAGNTNGCGFTVTVYTGVLPDLVVRRVDATGVSGDWQTLQVNGNVIVEIANVGPAPASTPFTITLFEDRNGNGLFEAGTDNVLGSVGLSNLGSNRTNNLGCAVAGTVAFRNNLIYAFADSSSAVAESNETNNYANSGQLCGYRPDHGPFSPVLEWAWTSSTVQPSALNILMTPAVVDLTGDGIPEVVFGSTASTGGSYVEVGYLRALRGDTGAELFTVNNPSYRINVISTIAVGDIDLDGRPEIIACDETGYRLIAFEHDGTFKWRSPNLEAINWGAPSLADLDQDGIPEIVIGRQVLNATNGSVRWTGTGGSGSQGVGPLSIVADVNLDGHPDVIAGNTVYNANGSILWRNAGIGDGLTAVANFDADPYPEIVLVTGGRVYLLGYGLTNKWASYVTVTNGGGGPPTIADFDGDGQPEIGVAGSSRYVVIETAGTNKWAGVTQDGSSWVTGSSVFDFEGDGSAEVVYRDELKLRVYRGTDGAILFETNMSSCTAHEYALVADVDADGNAEVVAVANNNCGFGVQRGVFVFGDARDAWVSTRKVWNQHSYHVTNVEEDGRIPQIEPNNWQVARLNNYRQNLFPELPPDIAPDLTVSWLRTTCGTNGIALTARIGNGGAIFVPPGVSNAFYRGSPPPTGTLLSNVTTTRPLRPGDYEDVTLLLASPSYALGPLYVVADSASAHSECNENNNLHSITNLDCNGNGLPDTCDIAAGTSADCNRNGIPDDCEAKPDLRLVACSAPPAVGLQPIPLGWTVANVGRAAASGFTDAIYLSTDSILDAGDRLLVTIGPQLSLQPGESYTHALTTNLPPELDGRFWLIFVTDASNVVDELCSETDNVCATSLVVNTMAPDLTVISIVAPPEAYVGVPFEVTWTVANLGAAAASDTWVDKVFLSTNGLLSGAVQSWPFPYPLGLAGGGSVARTKSLTITNVQAYPPAGCRLIVFTDANQQIPERNESNNVYVSPAPMTVHLPPLPDLVVTNIIAPSEVTAGETIQISWTVINQGQTNVQGHWTDAVYLSNDSSIGGDVGVASFPFQGAIAAGGSVVRVQTIQVPTNPIGNRWVVVRTDASNAVVEWDEVNNAAIASSPTRVVPVPGPDLRVTGLTVPPEAWSGQETEVAWIVENVGTAPTTTPTWYDAVYLSTDTILDHLDTYLGRTENLSYLEPGGAYSNRFVVTLPKCIEGDYYFIVCADADNRVYEPGHENDNCRATNFLLRLTPPPDLQVAWVNALSQANSGESMSVSWVITNAGLGRTLESAWTDEVFLATTNSLNEGWRQSLGTKRHSGILNSNDSYAANLVVTLPECIYGKYYFVVRTDIYDEVCEHVYKTNNVGAKLSPTTINLTPPPDLVVLDIHPQPRARAGEQIQVSWTTANQGFAEVTNTFYEQVFLSADDLPGNDTLVGTFTNTVPAFEPVTRSHFVKLPAHISGNRWVVVRTDTQYTVRECIFETNNVTVSSNQIFIEPIPLPNLRVISVTASSNGWSGQPIHVQWAVTNAGPGSTSAERWYDQVWLSSDPILDAQDFYLGPAPNPFYLYPEEIYPSELSPNLPRGIEGDYYVIVKADGSNDVTETNENDNATAGGPIHVTLTPPPDLQVAQVTGPTQAFSGQRVTVSWVVTNAGPANTPETLWHDKIYLSADPILDSADTSLGTTRHDGSLAVGETYPTNRSVTLPVARTGTNYFIVHTDSSNDVFEHNLEANNLGVAVIPIVIELTPPPDLAVQAVGASAPAVAGHALTVSFQVTNLASRPTPNGFWTDHLYLSPERLLNTNRAQLLATRMHYGALNSNDFYTGQFSATLPDALSGSFYTFVVADASNVVFELNKTNNTGFDPVPIVIQYLPPDLVVTNFETPPTALAGEAILVAWSVANQGVGDTARSQWTDRLVLSLDDIAGNEDDRVLDDCPHQGLLDVGKSYSVLGWAASIPFSVTPGTYNLFLTTDSDHVVYEGDNESNNTAGPRQLVVDRHTADLQPLIVGGPSSARSEETITVTWTVANSSTGAPNSIFWFDRVFLSEDDVLDTNDIALGSGQYTGFLPPGVVYTNTLTVALPAELQGTFHYIVKADSDDWVVENEEGNNVLVSSNTLAVTLAPVPDLAVTSVDAPATAYSGQSNSLSWIVENAGQGSAIGSWFDAVYLSLDQILDRGSDVYLGYANRPRGLAPGQRYTNGASFKIPAGLSGSWYVLVVADAGETVNERGEEWNNVGSDPLAVQVILLPPVDLVVGTITIPANAIPGQNATFVYTVTNLGVNTACCSWADNLYLSADDRWDIGDAYVRRAIHNGPVAGGHSYSNSLTAPLPGVVPGDYHVILRTDILNQIPEYSEANNIGASLNEVWVDVERLTFGVPAHGSIVQDQSVFYRFDATNGQTVRLRFTASSPDSVNELFVRFGQMPTRGQYDFAVNQPFVNSPELTVPITHTGTWYVLGYCDFGATPFTIEADLLPFSIRSIAPTVAGNRGQITLKIDGALFTSNTVFQVTPPERAPIVASQVMLQDAATVFATFNLFGAPVGTYGVRAIEPGNPPAMAELPNALVVQKGVGPQVELLFQGELVLRPNRVSGVQLEYANTGDADTPAPLLVVYSETGRPLGFAPSSLGAGPLHVLGLSADGPIDVLRPQTPREVQLYFTTPGAHGSASLRAYPVLASDPRQITEEDWQAIEKAARPVALSAEEWSAFWSNIRPRIGPTWGDYVRFLDRLAVELEASGQAQRDVRAMFAAIYRADPGYRASSFLAGTVLKSTNGPPRSGLEIGAYRLVNGHHVLGGYATTDANGQFTISFLPPAEYELALLSGGFDMNRDGQIDLQPPRYTVTRESDVTGLTLYVVEPVATPEPQNEASGSLAVDRNGRLHLAWIHGSLAWHAYNEAGTWTGARAISTGAVANVTLQPVWNPVSGDEAELLAVWEQGCGNDAEIYFAVARLQRGGYEWSQPQQLTRDRFCDSAPAVVLAAHGQALIAYLKRDASIHDDTDVYYSLVNLADSTLLWSGPAPSPAPAGDYSEHCGYAAEWGPYSGFGTKFNVGVDVGVDMELEGCSLTAGGSAAGDMSFRLPGFGGFDFEGSGAINSSWDPDRKRCAWEFKGAQLDASVSGTFVWKDGLVQTLRALGPQGMAAVTGIRTVIGAIHRFTPFRVENGVKFGVEAEFNDLRWTRVPPFPVWVMPDYVGAVDLTGSLGPYLTVTHRSSEDFELEFSGSIEGTIGILPAFKFKELSGNVEISAQIGWFSYSHSWPITLYDAGGNLRASAAPLPDGLTLIYNPTGAVGSANVYGPNALLTSVASDVFRDGAPVLASDNSGGIFAVWSKDVDPFGPQTGSFLQSSEFNLNGNGPSWTAPAAIPGTLGFHQGLAAVVDGAGRRLVVWSMAYSTNVTTNTTFEELQAVRDASDLFYVVQDGGTWTSPEKIVTTNGPDGEPRLAKAADGSVWLVWINMDSEARAHLLVSRWDGAAWALPPTEIASGEIATPQIACPGIAPTVLWTQDTEPDTNTNRLALFQSSYVSGAWTAPQRMETASPPGGLALAGAALGTPRSTCLPPEVPSECCGCQHIVDIRQGSGDCIQGTEFDPETCTRITFYEPCIIAPWDPNEIVGPVGSGPEHWVSASKPLNYVIHFANDPNLANAPVQEALIIQQPDADLDLRTFRLGDFGFGNIFVDVPDNRVSYSTRLDLRQTQGIFVDVFAGLNILTGEIYWRFVAIDPATGELPLNAAVGFLPLNLTPPEGEGFASYSIRAKSGVAQGTRIDAWATIVFDTEIPIVTPPIFNTLEVGAPHSAVEPMPSTCVRGPDFTVAWSGAGDAGNSALASIDIYVSDNGGPYWKWLTASNALFTDATFHGQLDHCYSFFSVARDHVGNSEAPPAVPDASVCVSTNQAPVLLPVPDQFVNVRETLLVTNVAVDPDTPSQRLTYSLGRTNSLGHTNPAGARINPKTGVFEWTPPCEDHNKIIPFTVWVSDGGVCRISNSMTFRVVVGDCVEPTLGTLVLETGQTGYLPLNLVSSIGLKRLCMTLNMKPLAAGTNMVLEPGLTILSLEPTNSQVICTTNVEPLSASQFRLCLATCGDQWLFGTQQVARLLFAAAPDQVSHFVTLTMDDISATTTNNFPAPAFGEVQAGQVVIISTQPLLEAFHATANQPAQVILYGQTNFNYSIEWTPSLLPADWQTNWSGRQVVSNSSGVSILTNWNWSGWLVVTNTNGVSMLTNWISVPVPTTSASNSIFFRAVQW